NPKARQFARATLRVAISLGMVEGFLDRLVLLARAFRESKAFRHLMITHRIPTEEKLAILRRAFAGILTELEFEVLHCLLERGLALQLPAVVKSLIHLAQVQGARMDLTVFTPRSLPEPELQSLGNRVAADIGRSLRVLGVVDPGLLGGIKLLVGNTLVDGTLARRLELLREQLV
ncbi:MAG: ATP synthase F1 subunit delta, partial [Candidatus Neomarinimicrobiota bacterium]